MALMSMTAWAAVEVTAPVAFKDLAYNGSAQALIKTEGSVTGTSNTVVFYYRVTTTTTAPTFNKSTWSAKDAIKGTDAGNYYVWYVAYDEDAATELAGPTQVKDEANNSPVVIGKKPLATTGISIATPADGTYTGADQKATYDAAVNVTDGSTTIPASEFTVSYQWCATADGTYEDVTVVTKAGYYKQKASGSKNYSGFKTSAAFQIAKADVLVTVQNKSGFFTNVALAWDKTKAADVVYTGFLEADVKLVSGTYTVQTGSDVVLPTIANANVDAGTYKIKATGGTSANYNFVTIDGTLTIDPLKVKVIAIDQTAPIGSDAATITSWTGKEYFSTETGHQAKDWIKLQVQNGVDGDGNATYPTTYVTVNATILGYFATTAYKDETEADQKYITGLTLTRAAGTEAKDYDLIPSGATAVNGNYELVYTKGKFTIGKAAVTIDLDNQAKVYGEADPEFTYTLTVGGKAMDEADEAAIRAKITVDRADKSENAGSYDLKLTVADNESFAKYTVPAEVTGKKLIITKRPVTISANDQVLYVGNTFDDLDQDAVTYNGLKDGESIKVDLSFSAAVTTDTEGDGSLNADGDDSKQYVGGIVVAVTTGQDAVTKNYTITLENGDLTVYKAAAVLFLDDTDENLATAIQTAASGADAAARTRTIQFSSRVLKAGQWNTMVLPFATTVAEVSELLGYAVVDMMATSTDPEVISLKLAFGAIPANTPFMVQPAADINLNTLVGVAGFPDKEIVYSATPEFNDGAGHKFIGTYVGHNVTSADKSEYYYSSTQKKFVNSSKSTKIGIMRAYLKDTNAAGAGARIITIEEPDGTVTAIDAVEAGVGETNGAIYNLQGVRVNKAGKGVFIQNGKKYIK